MVSRGSPAPEGIAALGEDVWTADKPDIENGLKILGSPLGKDAYVRKFSQDRVAKEIAYLEMVSKMPDLQCGWVMLSMSAVPRANHMIRMVPPSLVHVYSLAHDNAIWDCFCRMFAVEAFSDDGLARNIASMPSRLGGWGFDQQYDLHGGLLCRLGRELY